jgi:hypothetical protein
MITLSGTTRGVKRVVNVRVLRSGTGFWDILVGRGISAVMRLIQGLVNVVEQGKSGTGNLFVNGTLGYVVLPSRDTADTGKGEY